ncbi:hypothetical protein [Leucobacter sp. G161]|nr:hypothetical protein [Leucobacter sp. G161]
MAEATSSGEPVGPSAMQVMQSMLENTGRSAAEAHPATGPEEGDGNGEA